MSRENVELVRQFFKRWNESRDPAWFVEKSRADLAIFSRYAEVEGQPFVGAAGVSRWIREIDENFDRYDARADEVRDLEERVLALGSVHFQARGSGLEMEQAMGWLFEFKDGKFSRIRFFETPALALEAVGLGD